MLKNSHFQSVSVGAGVVAGVSLVAGAGVSLVAGAVAAFGVAAVSAGVVGVILADVITDDDSFKPVSFMLSASTVGGATLALVFNAAGGPADAEKAVGTPVADTSHTLVLDGDCTPERVTYDPATHQTTLSLPPGCAP